MSLSHPEIKTRPGDKSVLGMRVHSLQLGATQHAVAATSGRVSLAKARRVEALTFAEHMSLFFFLDRLLTSSGARVCSPSEPQVPRLEGAGCLNTYRKGLSSAYPVGHSIPCRKGKGRG